MCIYIAGTLTISKAKLTQYAGHITIDEGKSSNIFYWLIEAPEKPEEKPLLVWLNGGPGCSSMDGLWLELGPLRLEGGKVSINPHSWHNVANMLFVDQPVGTGFAYTKSKSGYAKSDDMVNAQFYKFLLGFFAKHPRYVTDTGGQGVAGIKKTRPFFMY
jgi:serine carboxypeptidase-like clade 2